MALISYHIALINGLQQKNIENTDTRLFLSRAIGTTKRHKKTQKEKEKKKFVVEGNSVFMTCGSTTWCHHQAWLGPKETNKARDQYHWSHKIKTYIQVSHATVLRTNGC